MIRGFSLIELMVVIAIISVLATVAVPAYSNFVTRSNISEVMTVMSGVLDRVHEYYDLNGVHPYAEDIGYTASTGVLTDPTDFHPYLTVGTLQATDGSSSSCGATYSTMLLVFNNNLIGRDAVDNYTLQYVTFNANSEHVVLFFELEFGQVPGTTHIYFSGANNETVDLSVGGALDSYIDGLTC